MNCPICRSDTRVLKTMASERRRQCSGCGHRFTTIERLKEDDQRLQEAVQTVREAAEKLKAAA